MYIEGLSITYGQVVFKNCPCADGGGPAAPLFACANWYCKSGGISANYYDDLQWDGLGCITSNCCNTLWFYTELREATTRAIEARICGIDMFRSGNPLVD